MRKTTSNTEKWWAFYSEKWWAFFFAISILGVAAVTVVLSDKNELPLTIVGAILGVAMTVFATYFLFKGQSKQQVAMINEELKQKQEVEIFKARLKAYELFLSALCAYLETKQEADKSKLKFHTAALAMHGDLNRLAQVNEIVKTIIDECNGDQTNDAKLIPSLFKLSEIFRVELYPEPINEQIDSSRFTESVTAFANSTRFGDENADPATIKAEDAQQILEIKNAEKQGVVDWDSFIKSLVGWDVSSKGGDIRLKKTDNDVVIEFKIMSKTGYYVVASSKGNDKEYPIELKNSIKGSYRSGVNWWRPLNTLRNYRVKSGALADEISTNDGARAVVINWIEKLIEFGK